MDDTYAQIPRAFNAAVHFVDRHVAEGRCERVALICQSETITYGQVSENVNRCAGALRSLGVGVGDRVLLLLLDGPEFAYVFFGAIRIGAVPVPTNTLLQPADYEFILDDSGATVAVASESLAPSLEAIRPGWRFLKHLVVVGKPKPKQLAWSELLQSGGSEAPVAATARDDVAFWLYTSGTTGRPKAAVHLQHDMVVCCEAFGRHVLEIRDSDRCFSVAELFFAYGLGNALYYPFHVGGSAVLHPGRFEPEKALEIITRERPTLFFAVPTAYAALLRVPDAERKCDLSSIRLCLSAGESLPAAIYQRWLERFGLEILDGIGSTEMCNTFIASRSGRVRPGSTGTPVPGYDARIVDDEGRDVPTGEVGNLLIKGESACAYYWNRPDRTRETITGGWVRTGDRYRRDGDGYFWYSGRTDDLIKAGGMWVSPIEVEGALVEHDAVLEAGVVGAPDTDQLIKPLAFVVLAPGREQTTGLAEELKAFVKQRLAPYKYPRWIVFVSELPKTATGKIQRYKLREVAAERPEVRSKK